MKKLYIIACVLVLSFVALGQQITQENRFENSNDVPLFDGDPPSGGKLNKYIYSQLRNPEGDIKDSITGNFMVLIKYAIDVDGSVVDTEIVRGAHPSHPFLDNEVLRVFNSMPKWTPAFNKGKPVKTQVLTPVFYGDPNKPNSEGQ